MHPEGALSLDVWTEIIRQFRSSPEDSIYFHETKNAVLRDLSLVSRQLYPLAQSEMWRTVSGVKHITRYIASAEGSNIVDPVFGKLLRRPLDAKCRERVLEMLSYTRTFVCKSSPGGRADLDLEFVLLAIGGQAPLFVNLNTIVVGGGACRNLADTNTFSIIASSSIERIVYHFIAPGDEQSVLLLHSNLRMHNAPITSVKILRSQSVAPYIAPRLLYTAAPGISLNFGSLNPHDRQSSQLWYLALSNSPNLVNLRIVFRDPGLIQSTPEFKLIGGEKIRFEMLQRLEVHATGREDVLSYLDCPSLQSFSLQLASVDRWSTIFTSLARFEQMESLSITIEDKSPVLEFEDLRPVLISLVSLRDLTIRGVAAQLVEGDILNILTMRPLLRTLVISSSESPLPVSILFSIFKPQISPLEIICLPIDLTDVASFQTPFDWPAIPSVKRFIVSDGKLIPQTMREKIKLVEFVSRLFPCARIVSLGRIVSVYAEHDYNREVKESSLVRDLEELRYYILRNVKRLSL